jgi:hypothetical protein
MEHAAADHGTLIFERELNRREYDIDSPRLRDLEQVIPMQEVLALGKLRGDEVFERLNLLGIRLEKT